ncbi:vasotab-like isoform X2 [Agrilus planipennis]|uniref:Vasotab-like isoform X1 n=1 Tax=Agrilus planipennis TaxID=224129 RepID=A0A7F5R890_AGRPL|nr:vasotab-like isoform X1 [Agrilus planipennis]XP_025832193.1 vasotab-like isoform X2 [Agrilus planipennis]XP_025832194.1 vasotab-like isoform X2 [Agrilus planipennis]
MNKLLPLLLVAFMVQSWSYAQDCPVCTAQYQPVCGVNGKGHKRTFSNACVLGQTNCAENQDYTFLRAGVCGADESKARSSTNQFADAH